MTERALELLNMEEENLFILDIGAGSGLSGEVISESEHVWIGVDISRDMLNVAVEKEVEGDLIQLDMGQGLKFRAGAFDAAISISAVQWLCVAGKKSDNPYKRIARFFNDLYVSLKAGGRAVLQFYPENKEQIDMLTSSALKAGFSGGLVVDYPNSTKAKKMYLVLDAGGVQTQQGIVTIKGLEEEQNEEETKVEFKLGSKKIEKQKAGSKKPKFKSKQWILNKKDKQRKKGLDVVKDSKYTGRKRQNLGMFG
eukprot:TRINITY_DN12746_c0_g2_i1.p3 TRINITY_DN12746_c0_g2~~TRINITY_DN12746_c0_g2_i1.p3  ORF type:complete len:253 (+),score=61.59 TRINITY_DN12746_c0_g2_i1:101-859(+)